MGSITRQHISHHLDFDIQYPILDGSINYYISKARIQYQKMMTTMTIDIPNDLSPTLIATKWCLVFACVHTFKATQGNQSQL